MDIAVRRAAEQRRSRVARRGGLGAAALLSLALALGAGRAEAEAEAEAEAARVERAAPVVVLRLADGREAAVAGVAVPAGASGEVAAAVAAWLRDGEGVSFPPAAAATGGTAAADRHGRLRAAPARGGETLQARLVADGLAVVAPDAGAGEGLLRGLLAVEAGARAARRGVWAAPGAGARAPGPFEADAVPPEAAEEGRFALVEGRIARIARTTMYWYANFGRSARRDFTFRVPLAAEGAFAAAGVDLAGLGGRRVRARGWLFEDNGPMLEITHPLALETLE